MNVSGLHLDGADGRRGLKPLEGTFLLLLLYEEDGTPLCSQQLASYRDDYVLLTDLRVEVVAASTDSLESHSEFLARIGGLPFPLLSDTDGVLARALQTWDPSTRRSRRAAFVIDQSATIVHAICPYNPAKLEQYGEDVLETLGFNE